MKRVPKGNRAGGQFAPDTRGATPPAPAPAPPPAAHGTPDTESHTNTSGHERAYEAFQHLHNDPIPDLPAPGEPPAILVLRGIPGSGKSTYAHAILDAHPAGTVARINNDDLSRMLFGSTRSEGVTDAAQLFHNLRANTLQALLKNPTIRLVIIDNTNLHTPSLNRLARIGYTEGATVTVDDRFLRVPVEECHRRNNTRPQPVPPNVIDAMHKRAQKLTTWTPPDHLPPIEPYHNNPNLPPVTIVDIDGTLATMSPDRGPYDWHNVHKDTPNAPVVSLVQGMLQQGKTITVFSGRSEECREQTQHWLDTHVQPGLALHMRPRGDNRPDTLIKYELFAEHIHDKHHVEAVFDDRDQVVDLWRRKLGLPVFQVADGDF